MSSIQVTGDYVTSPTIDVDDPLSTRTIVESRLDALATQGNAVMDLLIGSGGTGGLLGAMGTAIEAVPALTIAAEDVDTEITLETTGLATPEFDETSLVTVPTTALDSIDLMGVNFPDDITVALSWAESSLPSELFNAIKTQILSDLVDGSTGITSTIEDAIYARARNRQQVDRLAAYNRISDAAGQMQHAMPSGVLISALADFEIGANRQDAEIESSIIENQAKLAQENRKSAIQGAINLDQLIRQSREGESNRALDAAKSLLQVTMQDYAERLRKFTAYWEGKKVEVQTAAEKVKAALDTNKGLVEIFSEEVKAYASAEDAIAKKNDAKVKILAEAIKNASNDLEGQIAYANAIISAYGSKNNLEERVASEMASIASHCAIGLLSAANVSASMGYSGSESSSQTISLHTSVSETHSAEHDPDT